MFLWNVSLFPCQVVNAYYIVFFNYILLQEYMVFFHLAIRLQSYRSKVFDIIGQVFVVI